MAYDHFAEVYRAKVPWDIGKPQPTFVEVADQVHGSVIDLGCGTGEHALFFAQRGHLVTGIDFVAEVIAQANTKARERGLAATFLVQDALALEAMPQQFDSGIDSGLFHVFSDEERPKYVNGLECILKPNASVIKSRRALAHAAYRRRKSERRFPPGRSRAFRKAALRLRQSSPLCFRKAGHLLGFA